MMSADRDWSNLPADLLASISEHLGPLDLLRFAAVCSHWHRSVAISSPRMPYLLVADKGLFGGSCALLNLSDNRVHRISPFPELRDKLFVGSQFGWLITLDEFVNVSLFDPLTRSRIDLPPITTLPFIKPIYDSRRRTLIKYSFHRNLIWPFMDYPPEKLAPRTLRRNSFDKVVLSSDPRLGDDYTVVARFGCAKLTLFVRAGEKKWRLLDEKHLLDDFIYHEGGFIAVSEMGYIVSLDLSCNPTRATTLHTPPKLEEDEEANTMRYIVVDSLTGDLLHITRHGDTNSDTHAMEIVGITVRRLDSKEGTWSHVKSLGEQSLFIGNCYSTALAARDIPGLKPDCVYFTDDAWDLFGNIARRNTRDVGVLSLKDGCVERFNPPDNLPLIWPPPIFITPTIRLQQD